MCYTYSVATCKFEKGRKMREKSDRYSDFAIGEAKRENASGLERPSTPGKTVFKEEALARLVRSKAGHDKGTALVIVAVLDEEYVLVADGKLRSVEKPKKKKLRHLEVTGITSEELREKLAASRPIQNAELRKFISSAIEAEGK